MKKLKWKLLLIFVLLFMILPPSKSLHSQTGMFNMSYIFFGSPSGYFSQVEKTKGSLNVVAPNYFDVTETGNLDVTWTLDTSFINQMHQQGIKVVPFLANHWNRTAGINGLNRREALAKEVAAAVEKYNLDGVNVDIEGVGRDYRDEHTDFIRLLRQYIPSHKEISVATAANPNGWATGWHGFYDYNSLGKYADYLMIMAYDESWEGTDSPVGPVSSIQFFEKSIQYAINQGVPKDKIVVGLPFYGRLWKTDGPTSLGKTIAGMGLSSTRVEQLIKTFNGNVQFDEIRKSAKVTFTIPVGREYYIGNTTLTPGQYVLWYDNEQAIKAKLRMPSKYGIKGTGSWALSHETAQTWDYYSLWLNSIYFSDVAANYWAEESINVVSEKGWMTGVSNTKFAPTKTLTRAEGASIIVRALGHANDTPSSYTFTDTKWHWARKDIEVARELGYVNGKSKTSFDPDAKLTREELATLLYNVFKYTIDESSEVTFTDINQNMWSYQAIVALNQKGYITGYPNGEFRPKNSSLRAEMASLINRMANEFESAR
ncbi:glycosyl hydrolase family 18 protein [Ornithinibacillus sp. 179-J 7C1 HS]|uniref:glycosyl hydrolase family 18 protein n=1 Tax=Ornithinibacillus sp. 179-J 7C1 HS TaxID=3142384 RepID=UPI0039A21551